MASKDNIGTAPMGERALKQARGTRRWRTARMGSRVGGDLREDVHQSVD